MWRSTLWAPPPPAPFTSKRSYSFPSPLHSVTLCSFRKWSLCQVLCSCKQHSSHPLGTSKDDRREKMLTLDGFSGANHPGVLTETSTVPHLELAAKTYSEWTNGWSCQYAQVSSCGKVQLSGFYFELFLKTEWDMDPPQLAEDLFPLQEKNSNTSLFLIGLLWGPNERLTLKCLPWGLAKGDCSVHNNAGYS